MDSESAEQVLSSVVQLRSTWQALIQTKLEGMIFGLSFLIQKTLLDEKPKPQLKQTVKHSVN